jgi:hypothetical protein
MVALRGDSGMVASRDSGTSAGARIVNRWDPRGMGDWVKVEFWAQLPDGMRIAEVNRAQTGASLARFFGFSRVSRLSLEQVNDGSAPAVRELIDERPSDGQAIWPAQ